MQIFTTVKIKEVCLLASVRTSAPFNYTYHPSLNKPLKTFSSCVASQKRSSTLDDPTMQIHKEFIAAVLFKEGWYV